MTTRVLPACSNKAAPSSSVSDASGQMDSQAHPSSGLVGVPLRSNSIMMSRVRQAQFRELAARQRSGRIRGVMFLHLKLDLDIESVDWIGEQSPEDRVKPDPMNRLRSSQRASRKACRHPHRF